MKKRRWTDPDVPITILALKLAEEVGEVTRELCDDYFIMSMGRPVPPNAFPVGPESAKRTISELKHVEFIARTLRKRLEG